MIYTWRCNIKIWFHGAWVNMSHFCSDSFIISRINNCWQWLHFIFLWLWDKYNTLGIMLYAKWKVTFFSMWIYKWLYHTNWINEIRNLKQFSHLYFLDLDISLNIIGTKLKPNVLIKNILKQGTVSQIFFLGSSFHFMPKNK